MIETQERRFNRTIVVGLVAGFSLLIVAFVLIVLGLRNNTETNSLVRHTYEVKDTLSELGVALERSEAARRGYLIEATAYRLGVYRESSALVAPTLDKIEQLIADNPTQRARVKALRPLVEDEMKTLDRSMDLLVAGETRKARQHFLDQSTLQNLRRIRAATKTVGEEEERLLDSRVEQSGQQLGLLQWLLIGTGLMLAGVTGFTFWVMRRYTSALLASRATLHRLNTDLEGAVAERTVDLQRANDEIQRFAYIVSHDLRSPLVNVMGFTAEMDRADLVMKKFVDKVEEGAPALVNDEVRLAVNEDLPEAIGFVRSSTQKMDRLINAILALSRQGRRVLNPEHLPMDRQVGEIANSLSTLTQERGATISVQSPLPNLHHDRLAIDQIFSNLMENATKYLQPGRPGEIVVRGKRRGARAIFEIEDNGRGIAPSDHERIFELFRRSGSQDQAGEGIGLANVRALAYRLGGTVTVRSALNEGSTFIIDIPTTFSGEGKE